MLWAGGEACNHQSNESFCFFFQKEVRSFFEKRMKEHSILSLEP
jgi:hypothetical protein